METIFMYTGNKKTNEPQNFVFNLSQRLDIKSSSKHFAFQNLFIYFTWKNSKIQK